MGREELLIVCTGSASSIGRMRTQALHQQDRHDTNARERRSHLFREISSAFPPTQFRHPQPNTSDAKGMQMENCHAFQVPHPTDLARRLDSLFNQRYLTGLSGAK